MSTIAERTQRTPTALPRPLRYGLLLALILGLTGLWVGMSTTALTFPATWNLGLRNPIDALQSWVIGNRAHHPLFVYGFTPFKTFVEATLRAVETLLLQLPWPVHLLLLYAIAYRARGHGVAIISVLGLLMMGSFGLWEAGLATLALLLVAVAISLAIGIPLGILAARYPRVEAILRPVLDAMQTMPAFVYLIPVVLFFGLARTPSLIATVIYALPPAIRLTTLGIRQVDGQILEAANLFGSTAWQKLIKVQLPLALPSILLGVNQTIMMALGIVVIAALIGAGGLGQEVLAGLQRLRVGQALEAGLAIVVMAIIFDRISDGFSRNQAAHQRQPASTQRNPLARLRQTLSPGRYHLLYWGVVTLLVAVIVVINQQQGQIGAFPATWRLSIREPVDLLVKWMRDSLYEFSLCERCVFQGITLGAGPISDFMVLHLLNPLRAFLLELLPWPLVIAAVALLAHGAGGWRLAVGSATGMLLLGLLGMWEQSMDTLSQVLIAVAITIVLGIPLGIWAARNDRVAWLVRPILDFLQTIPPFVYLVPVIMLFNVGRVPGIIASVLYALPPLVRLTNLGIRQVAPAAVEAADLFGSTAWQKLRKVQLPLALPSIMVGINQAVMLVLSMVIIAGLVGGGALGFEAVTGLARNQLGRGIEAGLAIVILAMILDRITQGWVDQKR